MRKQEYSLVNPDIPERRIAYLDENEYFRYSDSFHSRNELIKIRYLFLIVASCIILILIFLLLNRYDSYVAHKATTDIQETEICIKTNAEDYIDQNYQLVIEEVKAMGFSNVLAIPKKDLVIGLFKHPGTVSRISIAGNPSFHADETYHQESKVIIEYHVR